MTDNHEYCLSFLRDYANTLEHVVRERGGSNVRIYGSFAQGVATDESDLDVLIDLPADGKLSAINRALADALGRSIDVVQSDKIFEPLRLRILCKARSVESFRSGKPDWAPVRSKDQRLHLLMLVQLLEKLLKRESDIAKHPNENDVRMLHDVVLGMLWRIRERLAMITPEFRASRADVPWADLETLVANLPDHADFTEPLLKIVFELVHTLLPALVSSVPSDEDLGREIAAAKPPT